MARRFPSVWRELGEARVPHRVLMVGAPGITSMVSGRLTHALAPEAVHDVTGDDAALLEHLVAPPRHRTRELVIAHRLPEPTPELLTEIRGMTRNRSQWLVLTAPQMPDDYWTNAFGAQIWNLDLTPNELLWFTQRRTHLPDHEARRLIDRCNGDPMAVLDAIRHVRMLGGQTGRDLDVVVSAEPEQAYASALLAGRYQDALAQADLVTDTLKVLDLLFDRLLLLWAAAELRPSIRIRPRREVSELLGITPEQVDELVPHTRRYPRSKVRNRLEALALVREHASAGVPRPGLMQVLAETWK